MIDQVYGRLRHGRRETHFGGRGAGLAGYRVRRVLSSPIYGLVRVVRLSGGVQGVDRLTLGKRERPGLKHTSAAFFRCQVK